MKNNFDIIAKNPKSLGIFLDKFITENNINGKPCKYCSERDNIICEADCAKGFMKWLKSDHKEI